jgi:hypothetical protein
MFFEAFPPTTGFSRDRIHVHFGITVHRRQGFHGTGHMCFEAFPSTAGFSQDRSHVPLVIPVLHRDGRGPGPNICSFLASFRFMISWNFHTFIRFPHGHRLNMESDLQSLLWLHVHSSTHFLVETPQPPPPPAFGLIYEGAIGQPR